MAAKTHGDRLDRLEQIVQVIAEDQLALKKLIVKLGSETRRDFDRLAKQSAKSASQAARANTRRPRGDHRLRGAWQRIDKFLAAKN
jgi:hypothetical protein